MEEVVWNEPRVIELRADGWVVPSSILGGLPIGKAELFGKPHLGAHYERFDRHSQKVEDGAPCVCCGRRAENAHHACPLGSAGQLVLASEWGSFVLLSALVAVCGSGTEGCHDGFHGGARYEIEWVWDSWQAADMWWSGWLLSHYCAAHSSRLFDLGHYAVRDKLKGSEWVHRHAPRPLW